MANKVVKWQIDFDMEVVKVLTLLVSVALTDAVKATDTFSQHSCLLVSIRLSGHC